MNDIATGSGVMNITGVWGNGLTGTGQIVGIADTGLDIGNIATIHSDLAGRTITPYALGRTGDWSDQNGHGTHVAGSVLGNGANSSNQYRGPAYTANLIFQSVMDATGGLGGLPTDLNTLFQTSYTGGARIHTNSWGAAVNGVYDTSAQQADNFAWNNKDMLILFAAGNEGVDNNSDGVIDLDSLSSPGTAKNVLTVGASENNRPALSYTYGAFFGYPTAPISTDPLANNVNGMAAFSSRGPTNDGRIKPDVVAPGTFIASTRSQKWGFDDNLEIGTTKWSTLGSWARTTSSAHLGSYSITDSPAGNYSDTSSNCLTSIPIDLRTGGNIIRFWHRYSFATNDRGRLYFSPNGSTWYYYTSPSSTFTGAQATWTETIFPLNSIFITSSFQFRFCVEPTNDGVTSDGWYIDDVRIYGGAWGKMSEVGLATSGDNTDEKYIMMGGTSMATPLTAGAATLVRQFYTDNQLITTPSAALLKATIINGASDMNPGQYGTGSGREMNARPNNVEGWGRVNVMNSIFPTAPRVLRYDNYTTGLSTGNNRYYQFTVNSSTEPLRATLVWTDYPSTPAASKNLVNDLDISIQNPSATTYYPNGLSGADTTNNVEGIDISSPATGVYCLAIAGKSIPNGPQPYALVVSGNITVLTPTSSSCIVAPPPSNGGGGDGGGGGGGGGGCGFVDDNKNNQPPFIGMMFLLLPVFYLMLRRIVRKGLIVHKLR